MVKEKFDRCGTNFRVAFGGTQPVGAHEDSVCNVMLGGADGKA
jgi:hypothetical protein